MSALKRFTLAVLLATQLPVSTEAASPPPQIAVVHPDVEAEIQRTGSAQVLFMIYDKGINIPWRGRHNFDASEEVAELLRRLPLTAFEIKPTPKASQKPAEVLPVAPISQLLLMSKGGYGSALVNAEGLAALRAQPLITVIDLNRATTSSQAIDDYDPGVRSSYTQGADLALFASPPLRGEEVHVAVLDQNIDSRHPAISPDLRPGFGVHHERCYATPGLPNVEHLCQDPNTGGGLPGTTTAASQSFGPGTARGPIDNDWAHGTGVTALVSGIRLPTSIPPVLPPLSTFQYQPPYLSPTQNITLTAIRVSKPLTATRAGPVVHRPDLMLAGTAIDWVISEVQAGNRPFAAINMSFGNTFEQSGDAEYNGDYAFQNCDYMLVGPGAIAPALSLARTKTAALRDAGVMPFAATGNTYLNTNGTVDNTVRALRAPSYAACLSSVVGVSSIWDNSENIPGVAQAFSNGTSACNAAPNRNACFAQRNKATKLAAPGMPTTAWMTYQTSTSNPNEQEITSFSTNDVHAEVNGAPSALVGTSFSAPWAMSCYAQLIQRFPTSGFPGLDRRDLIKELIDNPARSSRVVLNGIPDPSDIEIPLLQCQNALNRIQNKLVGGGPYGMPISNRFTMGGAWNNVNTTGQGFVLEVNPYPSPNVPLVFGGWFTYSTSGGTGGSHQRWFALQSKSNLLANASSIELDVFQVTGATFNQTNPPNTVTIIDVGDALLRFHNCSEASLQFSLQANSFVGAQSTQIIRLRKTLAPQRCHEHEVVQAEMTAANRISLELGVRDFGRNGAWMRQTTTPEVDDTGGQGLLLEQNANADLFFGAWYTFVPTAPNSNTPASERLRWFTLQPVIDLATERAIDKPGSTPPQVTYFSSPSQIKLRIFRTTSGTFNAGMSTTTEPVGTATLTWVNATRPGACNELDFQYQFDPGIQEFAGLSNGGGTRFVKIGAAAPGCTGP